MAALLNLVLDRWRLCAALASAAMLATAHAFETFGGYSPCFLCLKQREVYWTALAAAVAFMVLARLPVGARWRAVTCWVLGLIFLVGAGIAIYHAGAEWKFWPGPDTCAAARGGVTAEDLAAFLNGTKPIRPPSCEDAAWRLAGVSMAGWNALVSLGLVALSIAATRREEARS
jgi:disulfide bond formation protein DsbB